MASKRPLSRRKFLEVAAAAAAAPALSSCTGGSPSPWRCLSAAEARTAAAVCDTIVPPDPPDAPGGVPGAAWAGVVEYIDRQLTGPFADHLAKYRSGLAGVDQAAQALKGKPFADLVPEDRTLVLEAMEKGEAPGEAWKQVGAKDFFNLIVDHTLQGFYGDPRHGGNRDEIAWRMLGLSYPPVRGQRRSRFDAAGNG